MGLDVGLISRGDSPASSQLVGQLSLAAQGQPWFMMDKLAAGRDDDGSPVLQQAGLGIVHREVAREQCSQGPVRLVTLPLSVGQAKSQGQPRSCRNTLCLLTGNVAK